MQSAISLGHSSQLLHTIQRSERTARTVQRRENPRLKFIWGRLDDDADAVVVAIAEPVKWHVAVSAGVVDYRDKRLCGKLS